MPPTGVRRLKSRLRRGKLIELQDDSRWEVSPGYEIFTDHWQADTDITVVPGGVPDYPYDLINPDSGERVPARFNGIMRQGWDLIDN